MLFGKKNAEMELESAELDENVISSENLTDEELKAIAMEVHAHYTESSLRSIHKGYNDKDSEALSASKKKTMGDLKEILTEDERRFSEEQIEKMLNTVESKVYKYDILDSLIADDDVSDIKCYAYDNIRIKKKGKRMDSGLSFGSKKEYAEFVTRILERNNINFGTANADPTFTDNSQERAKLRISCISELLCDEGVPCVAIRKALKNKKTIGRLDKDGMFNKEKREETHEIPAIDVDMIENEELRNLIPELINSRGLLFIGKGASGKSTFMNALAELIPEDESGMIAQENSELFMANHPDFLCTHVLTNSGDSKISYGLSDLTRMGLLIDLDRIIVGEVKQADEAKGLSKASITGHKCWTSTHGENCKMGLLKMADYISQASKNMSIEDSLKQLEGFEYAIHMRNYQVDEIVKIKGWDYGKNELITEEVYRVNDAA